MHTSKGTNLSHTCFSNPFQMNLEGVVINHFSLPYARRELQVSFELTSVYFLPGYIL